MRFISMINDRFSSNPTSVSRPPDVIISLALSRRLLEKLGAHLVAEDDKSRDGSLACEIQEIFVGKG